MNVSQVIARAHIPQQEAALLKVGDKATLSVPGVEKPVDGKVTVVSPALDPGSTTVEVWVQAKNPKQKLMPGTSVQISMLAQTIPDALVVPAAALITAQDGTSAVMLVGADNRAHQKPVKVGIRQDDDVQIVDGLKEGDKVVAAGAYGLPDNTKITVEEAKSSDSKDAADDKSKDSADDKKDDKKPDAKAGDKDAKDDKNDKP
jgi:RND family efflux transporter MFP subunit